MTDDSTFRPEQTNPADQSLQHQELQMGEMPQEQAEIQMETLSAKGVACPHCGTVNDPDALFCATCGKPLRMGTCPHCGNEIDPEADYCEVCHHYIKSDACSFCGAYLSPDDAFCPDCGSPRGGIVCPTCNTLNDFAFCKQCGTPLTDEARRMAMEVKAMPEYKEMMTVIDQLEELDMQLPYSSERDLMRIQKNDKLRERVLMLLAKDRGELRPVVSQNRSSALSEEEFKAKKDEMMERLSALLDKMALPPQPSPAKVRNYAMAQKPVGVRLAWVCNFKHAMHSSPCGCAKPQLGGKWVILGKNSKQEIKDDK